MHIEFAEIDKEFIKQSVQNGYYRSESEAVRDAVRRAREEAETKREWLFEALRSGDADIATGKTHAYSQNLFEQIKQDAIKHAAKGEKPKSDVIY